MNAINTKKKGFTLLELLVVIAIIAVLSVLLIIVLDPAETLARARDSQRVSDLNTLKTALGIYLTNTSTPQLGSGVCFTGGSTGKITYSYPNATANPCSSGAPNVGSDANGTLNSSWCQYAPSTSYTAIDGTGWIPVNFLTLTGGAPISNLPVDPTDSVGSVTAPTSTDLVYRYTCQMSGTGTEPVHAFQLGARLESKLYGPGGTNDLTSKDGALNTQIYEVGSDSRLFGTSTGF